MLGIMSQLLTGSLKISGVHFGCAINAKHLQLMHGCHHSSQPLGRRRMTDATTRSIVGSSLRLLSRAGLLACALPLVACGSGDMTQQGGSIRFTASGEVLALGGYPFPPMDADSPAFVDGWEVRFDALLVTLDKITLSENPDKSPTDQSLTDAQVAEVSGPWAVDLHKGGPLLGKGGGDEQAFPFSLISGQTLRDNKPFDATQRYALGFDMVPASTSATKLNFDAQNEADYREMVQKGWTMLYVGTATWRGGTCTSTNPAYDWSKLPTRVKFRFGFTSPTTYKNCQNPDNAPAQPFANEEYQRGVQIKSNATTIAQATMHTDHVFWESIEHDSPAHFDPFAAYAKKNASGEFVVTLDDLKGVNFTAFTDASGSPLPWRSCLPTYTPPNTSMSMGFDTQGVPYSPSGNPSMALRDFADYVTYNQSTEGHLNADGLCFVERSYPSPK